MIIKCYNGNIHINNAEMLSPYDDELVIIGISINAQHVNNSGCSAATFYYKDDVSICATEYAEKLTKKKNKRKCILYKRYVRSLIKTMGGVLNERKQVS